MAKGLGIKGLEKVMEKCENLKMCIYRHHSPLTPGFFSTPPLLRWHGTCYPIRWHGTCYPQKKQKQQSVRARYKKNLYLNKLTKSDSLKIGKKQCYVPKVPAQAKKMKNPKKWIHAIKKDSICYVDAIWWKSKKPLENPSVCYYAITLYIYRVKYI
jgi:hypothetical protein